MGCPWPPPWTAGIWSWAPTRTPRGLTLLRMSSISPETLREGDIFSFFGYFKILLFWCMLFIFLNWFLFSVSFIFICVNCRLFFQLFGLFNCPYQAALKDFLHKIVCDLFCRILIPQSFFFYVEITWPFYIAALYFLLFSPSKYFPVKLPRDIFSLFCRMIFSVFIAAYFFSLFAAYFFSLLPAFFATWHFQSVLGCNFFSLFLVQFFSRYIATWYCPAFFAT